MKESELKVVLDYSDRLSLKHKERLQEENPDAILFDGLDDAIVGIGNQYTKAPVAIYSVAKILQILSDEHGYDGAVEWFDYNIACLWAGEHTPILMQDDV